MNEVLKQLLQRSPNTHKYDYGHVLIIGGGEGMVGAPLLAAKAALRSGAGLVTIASHEEVINKLEGRLEEAMTFTLPATASAAIEATEKFIIERRVSTVVIGPGLTTAGSMVALIKHLYSAATVPVIIDGSALTALSRYINELPKPHGARILTPHDGEFNRFVDEVPKKLEHRAAVARDFALKHHITLVLKGNPTFIANSNSAVLQEATGTSALATAGTGDVLTGVIAAVIAQTSVKIDAVFTAVKLHGLAGRLAAHEKTDAGVIASDVIDYLPLAYKQLSAHSE